MANRFSCIFDAGRKGNFSSDFLMIFWAAVIKSATSADSRGIRKPESRQKGLGRIWKKLGAANFQAVIKLDAIAASPTAWGSPGRRLGCRRQGRSAPQAVGEAAQAADLIMASTVPCSAGCSVLSCNTQASLGIPTEEEQQM